MRSYESPGKLTDEEFDVIKSHCWIRAEVIGEDESELLRLAREMALTHHEKWNGTGYAGNKKDEDIPSSGRILAFVDVFDALTSDRPYKKECSVEEVVGLLEREVGKYFELSLVALFIKSLPKVMKASRNMPSATYRDCEEPKAIIIAYLQKITASFLRQLEWAVLQIRCMVAENLPGDGAL